MRIGIPTFGADNGKSGIGEYLRALLNEWRSHPTGHEFVLIGPEEDKDVFFTAAPGWTWQSVADSWASTVKNLVWHQTHLPPLVRQLNIDVLFLPAGNRRLPYRTACPTVGTVHDFSHLHVKNKYDRWRHIYVERVLPFLVRRLTSVITVSQCSALDLLDFAKVKENKLTVVHNGAELDAFRALQRDQCKHHVRTRLGMERPFVLYVSRLEHPGKNHVALIEGFENFRRETGLDWDLLLPGQDWSGSEAVYGKINESPERDRIKLPGFLSREDLLCCYGAAEQFVFPSLYEGFGIPLLEAMAAGVPVLAADRSSLPEVGGEAALYFDPDNPKELAECMARVASDELLRRRMVTRGAKRADEFSWSKTAQQTMQILEDTAQASQSKAA